jgi:hypothetical protein
VSSRAETAASREVFIAAVDSKVTLTAGFVLPLDLLAALNSWADGSGYSHDA